MLGVTIVLLGCGGSSQPAAGSESGAPSAPPDVPTAERRAPPRDKPRFNWPVSRAIPVVHEVTHETSRTQARYWLHICSAPKGRLRIELRDLRLVAIDGLPTTDPRVADRADTAAPELAAIPALIVDTTGVAVAAEGLDELQASLVATFSETGVERVRRRFATEKGRETLRQAAYARWQSWVQAWLGYEPHLGREIEVTSNVAGRPEKHRLSFDGWNGAHARLSFDSELSKEGAKAFHRWVYEANEAKEPEAAILETAEVTQHGRVETDWPDLRPHWVFHERTIRLTVAGERRERTHSHEYRFDWANDKAATCRR
jgi:hypothetical protein